MANLTRAGRLARDAADQHLEKQARSMTELAALQRFRPRDAVEAQAAGRYVAAYGQMRGAERMFQAHVYERRLAACAGQRKAA